MGKTQKKDFIKLSIELDEKKMPVKIHWTASGKDVPDGQDEVKAFFLTMFDAGSRDTLEMDLWTTKMQVIEMDRFVFQSLHALANLYMRATNNRELAAQMMQFVQYFGQKTEIIK